MTFEITSYAVISAIGAFMAVIVAIIAMQRQDIPGGKSLTWLMIAASVWAGGAAMEHATIGIPMQIMWSKFEYLGTLSSPVLFLIFALEYNHYNNLLTRRNITLFFVVPIITLILTLTNEWHNLIWTSFIPSPVGDNITIFGHGIGFWIGAVGYSYFVMMAGTILLIRGTVGLPEVYRWQIIMVVIAALLPWVVNFLYILGLSPAPGLELTPLVIVLTGMILAWAIFRFHLLDLVPIARHNLVETMPEGMLVLDQQNRVVDMNPSARNLLGEKVMVSIGGYAGDIFKNLPQLRNLFMHGNPEMISEITVEEHNGDFIEVSISPIHDWRNRFTGQFVIFRDITEKRRFQDEIQRVNENLRLQLAENESLQAHLRERAIRDSLTGLFNRRYLDETFERELARAKREKYEISVLMIDIDHFKQLNDTYGHKAGDLVLKSLGEFLLAGVRQSDIVCRYGGEEFLIIMPGVHIKDAQFRAETICSKFNLTIVDYEGVELHATISIGLAFFPKHGNSSDEIIRAADSAMYAAKQAGRNTVCVKQ